MYFLELHGMAIEDYGQVTRRSFVRQLGGRSGFLSSGLLEAKLIRLCKDEIDTDWLTAFAIGKDGVVAYWERDSSSGRTGEATDLTMKAAVNRRYTSRYFAPVMDTGFVCRPWEDQAPLEQVIRHAEKAWLADQSSNEVVFFDRQQRRVAAALRNNSAPEVTDDGRWPIAIGEHIA